MLFFFLKRVYLFIFLLERIFVVDWYIICDLFIVLNNYYIIFLFEVLDILFGVFLFFVLNLVIWYDDLMLLLLLKMIL